MEHFDRNKFKHMFKKRISDLINDKRDLYNIKQIEQAEKIGIGFSTLAKYSRGELLPCIDVLYRMAKYYNVSADYILGLSNSKSPSINERYIACELGLSDKTIAYMKDWNDKEDRVYPDIPESPVFLLNHIFEIGMANKLFAELFRYIYSKPDGFKLSQSDFGGQAQNSSTVDVYSEDFSSVTRLTTDDVEYIFEQSLFNTIRDIKAEILKQKLDNKMPNHTFCSGITRKEGGKNGEYSSKEK